MLKTDDENIKQTLRGCTRFKFCGDGDCPDYILAIIHSNLSGLSSLKLKVFASKVVKIILSNETVDEGKFADVFEGSFDDSKAAYLCVRFLLLSTVRFNIGKDIFAIELQQLGFPREHSLALGKVLDEHSSSLREYLKTKSLTINELTDVKCVNTDESIIDCAKLQMEISKSLPYGEAVTKEIIISNFDIPLLLKELKFIKSKMNNLAHE